MSQKKAREQRLEQKFEVDGRKKLSEEEIRQVILKNTDNIEPKRIGTVKKAERDEVLAG